MILKDINQIRKGLLKILVLKLLSKDKKYGYELIIEMDKRSKGFFKVKEGTLYPILYKLEDDGFVTSEWEIPNDRTKAKKYYYITESGQQALIELIDFWNCLTVNMQDFLCEKSDGE